MSCSPLRLSTGQTRTSILFSCRTSRCFLLHKTTTFQRCSCTHVQSHLTPKNCHSVNIASRHFDPKSLLLPTIISTMSSSTYVNGTTNHSENQNHYTNGQQGSRERVAIVGSGNWQVPPSDCKKKQESDCILGVLPLLA
jgi:hypothetical protein